MGCTLCVTEILGPNGKIYLVHAFSQILLLNDGMRGLKFSSGEQLEPSCNPGFVQLVTEAAHCFVSVGCHQGEHCNDQSVRFLISRDMASLKVELMASWELCQILPNKEHRQMILCPAFMLEDCEAPSAWWCVGIQALGKPDGDPMYDRRLRTEVWEAAVKQIQLTPNQLQQILQIR